MGVGVKTSLFLNRTSVQARARLEQKTIFPSLCIFSIPHQNATKAHLRFLTKTLRKEQYRLARITRIASWIDH